ncbi:MAG: porin family protein [Novosphingobium sp.]
MRKILLPLAVSAMIASPAVAREFAGPYVGAGVTLDNVQGSGPAEGVGVSGVGGTAFLGYDLPLGESAFAGVEANIDLASADEDNLGFEAKWGWGVGARLGYKLNESTALYGRVGYARAKSGVKGCGSACNVWSDGVRYGAGLETSLTQNLSLRAEFSQYNFEDDAINNQAGIALVYGF